MHNLMILTVNPKTCACLDCFPGNFRDWINRYFCSVGANSNAIAAGKGADIVEDEAPRNDLSNVDITANPDINVRVALVGPLL